MGRQVRFYMLREDEIMLLEHIRKVSSDPIFVAERQRLESIIEVDITKLAQAVANGPLGETMYIWDKGIGPLCLHQFESGEVYVDDSDSMAIQFCRGGLWHEDKNQLEPGRLWVETYWRPDGHSRIGDGLLLRRADALAFPEADKPQAFLRWYQRVFSYIRRHFKNVTGDWLAPAAVAWYKGGGSLSELGDQYRDLL